jgi:hypothetical protein
MSTFEKLAQINTQNMVEKKGRFNYLSWAHAWAETCKVFSPTRKVYKSDTGCNYHTDGRFAWVEVGVTIEGIEHIDMLPIINHQNKSIAVDKITSMDVNTAIQRSTVKALALHGLGLNIYAGEDLPLVETPKVMMTAEHCKTINDKIISADVEGLMDQVLDTAKVKDFSELEDGRFQGLLQWITELIEDSI